MQYVREFICLRRTGPRFTAITDEHKVEGAQEQLAAGWKAWLVVQNPTAAVA